MNALLVTTRSLLLSICLLSICVASIAAQRQLIVDATGGGDFRSIAPAVAAAAAGDTIVVRAGEYREPLLDIDKGIALVGEAGVTLLGSTLIPPHLSVHDIPAHQTFRMRGFTAEWSLSASYIIDAQRCPGLVSFQSMQGLTRHVSFTFGSCGQVELKNITSSRLSIRDARIVAQGSVFEGDGGGPISGSGDLALVGCSVTVLPSVFFPSTPGIHFTGRTLTLTRSTVSAARNGTGPASAIVAEGVVRLDPTTTLVPWMGAPPIGGSATVDTGEVASLRGDSSGSELTVDLHGVQSSDFVVLLSLPAPALPTFAGDLWVSSAEHLVVQFGSLGTNRSSAYRLEHGAVPKGFVTTLQAVLFIDRLLLSTPSVVVFP